MTSTDFTAEDADDPAKSTCLKCQIGRCADCLWRDRPTACDCLCAWLVADVQTQHPSLRETE